MKVFVLDNLSTSNRGILHLIILFFSTSLLSLWNLLSLSFEKWWWSGGNCLCHCHSLWMFECKKEKPVQERVIARWYCWSGGGFGMQEFFGGISSQMFEC